MKKMAKSWEAKNLKKHFPAHGELLDEELKHLEDKFIENYVKSEVKPLAMLLKIYLRFWRELLASMFFYTVKHVPVIMIPIVTAHVVNFVAYPGQHSLESVILAVSLLVVMYIIHVPAHVLHVKYNSKATRKVEAALRGAMVRKLQQLSINFHKEMQSGRIQAKLLRDIDAVNTLSSQLFVTVPGVIIDAAAITVIVINMNPLVFGFFLLCIPVSVLTTKLFKKNMASVNKNFRVEMEKASSRLSDMVTMTEITRAHAIEDIEIAKIHTSLRSVAKSGLKTDILHAIFGSTITATTAFLRIACLGFCVALALNSMIQVGDIALYQSYFVSLVGYVNVFVSLLPIITKGLDSMASIGEILSATDIEQTEGKLSIKELRGEYEFCDVSFSYNPEALLLRDFNLHVKPGETIAFVGESGSGKTTTMNLVLGFYLASSGQLRVDGHDIKDIDLKSYRSHIAIVPQNSVLFCGTIRENITYGMENVTDDELRRVVEAAQLASLIDSLPEGLDTVLTEHGSNLSGGQRQRLCIARAIIRNPSVIIFDEATSALDSVSEREIQKAIDNLARNRTTFIVAHRLSTIKNADRIAVLKNGSCVEIGSFDELMEKKGLFYKMQTAQQ